MFRKLIRRWHMRKWAKFRVVYDNGSETIMKSNELKITSKNGRLLSIEWEGAWPTPMNVNVGRIVVIYKID